MPATDRDRSSTCGGFRRAGLSRRHLLEAGALGTLGLGLPQLLAAREALPGQSASSGFGRAKRCILLFMWGGPSHLDTWDLKPDAPAEVRGDFKPIETNVPGIRIGEHFPLLARQADKYAIIRSLGHNDAAHLSSVHHLTTGRLAPRPMSDADPPSREDWPHIGSMLSRLRPTSGALPATVTLPWIVSHPAAPGGKAPGQHGGMLGPGYDPFVVQGDPNAADFEISGLALPAGVTLEQMQARSELVQMVDRQARRMDAVAATESFGKHRQRALDLVASPRARAAFDLNQETDATREKYGRNIHGQAVLLARRLSAAGVPLVTVNWHNDGRFFWDTHGNNFNRLKDDLMPWADRAFAALLSDLAERGLLDETLVVWVGEFGRTPRITANNAGREHWPWCYSGVLAGGGIAGGQVYGRSDALGAYAARDPVAPADLTATMYHALGVPHNMPVHDRQGRPVPLTAGRPVGLFG